MICYGLVVVMWCSVSTPAPVDSFCLTYQKVVQEKGDGSLQGTIGAKKRVLANELIYNKNCKGGK